MTRFESPLALLLLLAIPVAWLLMRARDRRASVVIPSLSLASAVGRSWRTTGAALLTPMRLFAIAALVLAVARPQSGVGKTSVVTEGVAMMMVVDRSGSMNEAISFEGRSVTRIAAVRQILREFVLGTREAAELDGDGAPRRPDTLPGRPDDLIGIVTFARYAETICPLVRDPRAVAALVDTIELPILRAEDGTAIGDGVALAAARLKRAEEDLTRRAMMLASGRDAPLADGEVSVDAGFTIRGKAIVLLTDGEWNTGEVHPLEAAQMAKEWGIRVYTIAVGGGDRVIQTPMGPMRVPARGIDETLLREMASMTGGKHFSASDADGLREIYAAIDALEKTRVESRQYTEYEELFWPFAAAGAGLLALELLLGATILRRTP